MVVLLAEEHSSIIYDVSIGVAGNLVFALAAGAIAFGYYYGFRRKALREFFGVGEENSISIYTAHLRILQGGSTDVLGTIRSYSGSATVHGENAAAGRLARRFSGLFPGFSSQFDALSHLTLTTIAVESGPSPMTTAGFKQGQSFVSIGSPGYNIISAFVENNLHSPIRFLNNNVGFTIPPLAPITVGNQGFLVRIPHGRHFAFYAAGLSEAGTCGAVQFLAENWLRLHKTYGGARFYALIEVNFSWENPRLIAEGVI